MMLNFATQKDVLTTPLSLKIIINAKSKVKHFLHVLLFFSVSHKIKDTKLFIYGGNIHDF